MKFKTLIPIFCFGIVIGLVHSCNMEEKKNEIALFVGTYTNNGSEGIYRFNFNRDTGTLLQQRLAATSTNPSFLTISPDRKTLYAVSEVDDFEGDSGAVITFTISDTVLKKIGTKSTYGANPCYVAVSEDGKYVTIANYTGGNVAVFNTNEKGDLLPSPKVIDHKVLDTSTTSHAHMAAFINRELFVSDLGLDRVKKYSLESGNFYPSQQPELVVANGAGPRHFVSFKGGEFLYVINELNSTITGFKKAGDMFHEIETYDTVSKDFEGESFCADIHLSPDGNYLYGSNRGENTIVIFKVNDSTGKLALVGRESIKGDWPRNFAIDPSGEFLLVANQRSNNIVVFKRNATKGTLTYISEVALPSPVCLQFY